MSFLQNQRRRSPGGEAPDRLAVGSVGAVSVSLQHSSDKRSNVYSTRNSQTNLTHSQYNHQLPQTSLASPTGNHLDNNSYSRHLQNRSGYEPVSPRDYDHPCQPSLDFDESESARLDPRTTCLQPYTTCLDPRTNCLGAEDEVADVNVVVEDEEQEEDEEEDAFYDPQPSVPLLKHSQHRKVST